MIRMMAVGMGLLVSLCPAAASAAQPVGLWLDASGRAAIDIEPCGEQLCGQIAWLKTPLDARGAAKTDIHNQDVAQRGRPLCGLKLLAGFNPDGDSAWSDGTIYDPEKGATYKSNMHVQPDGTLRVRGYIGISLLGRSETWTRPAATLNNCGGHEERK
jgi:uncharacterized protein (DUF2147 family)